MSARSAALFLCRLGRSNSSNGFRLHGCRGQKRYISSEAPSIIALGPEGGLQESASPVQSSEAEDTAIEEELDEIEKALRVLDPQRVGKDQDGTEVYDMMGAKSEETMVRFFRSGHVHTLKRDPTVRLSPWHELSLEASTSTPEHPRFHFVCEVPRRATEKYDVSTTEHFTPIRRTGETLPEAPCHYGFLPQTYLDPDEVDGDTNLAGDGKPLDAFLLHEAPMKVGESARVKVLGAFSVVDRGETDWKLLCVSEAHPRFHSLNSAVDVEEQYPGEIQSILRWILECFEGYGSSGARRRVHRLESTVRWGGQCQPAPFALQLVVDFHSAWKELVLGVAPNPDGLWIPTDEDPPPTHDVDSRDVQWMARLQSDPNVIMDVEGLELPPELQKYNSATGNPGQKPK